MGSIKREQIYTITLIGNIEITTRGYDPVERDGHTIIPDTLGKPVFMTLTTNIVNIQNQNMPLFS